MIYTKKTWESNYRSSHMSRLSHCPLLEDKQCRSPRCIVYHMIIMYNKTHGTLTLLYPVGCVWICEIRYATDKTFVQRLFIYMFVSPTLLPVRASELTTVQIYKYFSISTKYLTLLFLLIVYIIFIYRYLYLNEIVGKAEEILCYMETSNYINWHFSTHALAFYNPAG